MKNGRISVCMATFNGEKFVFKQVDSILAQLRKCDELIISDDGSSDKTIQILESFHDDRITILQNQFRHGFVGNFENALCHAKGDYIFLSDQDDVWKSNKVVKMMQALDVYELVIHDAELIDGFGNTLGKNYYATMHKHTGFLMNLWKTRWLGCCMAFRREVLDYCLPFPPNIVAHDYWIGMLGMLNFKYCFMDDILICYRRHGDNVSPSSEKSNNSLFYKIYTKRFHLIIAIIERVLFKK